MWLSLNPICLKGQILQTFLLSPSKNKLHKFFSISIVDTYFQVYFSLFLYQLTSYSAQSKYGDQSRGKKLCIWVWASLICTLELVTQPPIGSAASVGRGPLAHGGLGSLRPWRASIKHYGNKGHSFDGIEIGRCNYLDWGQTNENSHYVVKTTIKSYSNFCTHIPFDEISGPAGAYLGLLNCGCWQ